MNEHFHKVEFKCRKCGKEQTHLLRCSDGMIDLGSKKCEEYPCQQDNMWVGKIEWDREYPGSILSPIQPIIL